MEPFSSDNRDFTVNAALLSEPGKVLEIIRLRTLTTPNVKYLGAFTVWPRNRDSISETGFGFPEDGAQVWHPAFGTPIPAAETGFQHPDEEIIRPVWVQAGFRLTSGAVGAVNDVEVTYRADDEERRVRSGNGAIVCVRPCDDADRYKDVLLWERDVRPSLGIVEADTPAEPLATARSSIRSPTQSSHRRRPRARTLRSIRGRSHHRSDDRSSGDPNQRPAGP